MREKIIYRTIQKKDYEKIQNMIVEVFNLEEYINNEKVLQNVKKHYLYSCLVEATYINIAEKDGEIIGVIMGNSNRNYNFFKHLNFIIKSFKYRLKIEFIQKNTGEELGGYKKLQEIYAKLLEQHKKEFDGVLTLFLVDKNYRGLGIGYNLLINFFTYLKKYNTQKIYLYTDTSCNYMFYEKHGFKCIGKDRLNLLKKNKEFILEIFLYEYLLE